MRLFSPLPQLLVAGAALGGSLLPFAVGSAPTESKGIAVPSLPSGADFPICRGYGSANLNGGVLHYAQLRTEVPQAPLQALSPAAAFADTDPPLWEALGGVSYRVTTASGLAQSYLLARMWIGDRRLLELSKL